MLFSRISVWEEEGIIIIIIIILVVFISMHACVHTCLYERWWLASGVHANVFHCVRDMATWCVHVRMPYWVVRAMHGWWMDDCDEWQWWCLVRSCERVIEWIWWIEWMNAWTDCCLCVCLCMWLGGRVIRSTCLQGGAVYIYRGVGGTFTNCNFNSNSATTYVSLEGMSSWLTHSCFLYRFTVIVPCECDRSWSHSFRCYVVLLLLLLLLCICVYT